MLIEGLSLFRATVDQSQVSRGDLIVLLPSYYLAAFMKHTDGKMLTSEDEIHIDLQINMFL